MRIKFETARDVLTAFPTLKEDITVAPDGTAPITFLKQLAQSETPEDCISFFAYLAPRRDSVWWCCRSLDTLGPGGLEAPEARAAAKAWVAEPEEARRHAALSAAEAGPSDAADTWAAFGAAWSGGSIGGEGEHAILAAPHLTAKAVRASLLVAVSSAPFAARRARLERCLDEALMVANDDIEAHFGA
ncbi:MAG: hypothetical protein AAGJ94_04760 [Pseudomonadota bacterium]